MEYDFQFEGKAIDSLGSSLVEFSSVTSGTALSIPLPWDVNRTGRGPHEPTEPPPPPPLSLQFISLRLWGDLWLHFLRGPDSIRKCKFFKVIDEQTGPIYCSSDPLLMFKWMLSKERAHRCGGCVFNSLMASLTLLHTRTHIIVTSIIHRVRGCIMGSRDESSTDFFPCLPWEHSDPHLWHVCKKWKGGVQCRTARFQRKKLRCSRADYGQQLFLGNPNGWIQGWRSARGKHYIRPGPALYTLAKNKSRVLDWLAPSSTVKGKLGHICQRHRRFIQFFFFTSRTHQHILFATFLNCDVFFWCCIHVCHCFSFFMLHKRNVHKAFKSYFEMCIYKVHISKATLTALFRIKTFFASDTLQEYHMQTLHNSSPNETEQDMLILQHPDLLHWLQAERLLDWNIITFLLFFKHNSFVFICRILLVTNHHNLSKWI